jgi:hypothetical protein
VRISSRWRSRSAVAAPGQGVTARCRFQTVTASSAKSTTPSRLPSLRAYEPALRSWARRGAWPACASTRVSASSGPPIVASLFASVPASSAGSIATQRWSERSPVSSPSSIHIVVTPVPVRPSQSERWTGDAPR